MHIIYSNNKKQSCTEIDKMDAIYQKSCDCGHKIQIISQTDNSPEYRTTIAVKCPNLVCNMYVLFKLAVN